MTSGPSDRWIDVGGPSIDRQRRLSGTVAPLAELPLWIGIALALVPFLFPVLAFTAIYTVTMGSDPGLPEQFANLPLGIGYCCVLAVLRWRFDDAIWRASAVFRRPSIREIGAALLAAIVGIGIVIGINRYAATVGFEPHDPGQVTTSVDLAILLFGSVLVAPIAEELLFRGLVFGQLLSRGYGLLAAAVLSVLLFTVIHVFIAGLVSIAVAGVLGALLTVLRVWYDNLVGAWLMHALINTAALLIALAVLPAPW
ncbi:CPBP family intramembrane metalloprotease [Natrinema zhouii]|uniref:CPBP family intramembrane metalloprotease n=1 Tax=Natrinema zhouii TaxID=1710539 RepID=A0A7D6CPC2_9EURY|nr:type II CAAX endopeptidase family protein [Natrinema zhouii]QLK24970.1 CPBP family intramembrane metalloprotease [Natrinema zhouii]